MSNRLPEKLAISFPIWCLLDTPGDGVYHDLERVVREHAERAFNCIRTEDGAGLIRFRDGKADGKVLISEPVTGFSAPMRQTWCMGNGGICDLTERMLALFEAAAHHKMYVILSSWYYLHTVWYCGDEDLNRRLLAIPPHERFQYFAEQLNGIIGLLRKHGLSDRIAFAEILNEADGLPFVNGYDGANGLSVEERNRFRDEHSAALAYLKKNNPDIRFAYDTYTPYTDPEQMPQGMDVWDFHSYFMWDIYSEVERKLIRRSTDVNDPAELGDLLSFFRKDPKPLEEIRASRAGKAEPLSEGWARRYWIYCNLDPNKTAELDRRMAARLEREQEHYRQKIRDMLAMALKIRAEYCPEAELVMGEGVSFCGNNCLQWEERSEAYWDLLEFAYGEYRKAGLSGCVPRSCCGPEDPSWTLCADKLKHLNELIRGI